MLDIFHIQKELHVIPPTICIILVATPLEVNDETFLRGDFSWDIPHPS